MTTSSDRVLLRWVPIVALLAAAVAVGLTVGPPRFGYHGWPQPTAPKPIERMIRMQPARESVGAPGTGAAVATSDLVSRPSATPAVRGVPAAVTRAGSGAAWRSGRSGSGRRPSSRPSPAPRSGTGSDASAGRGGPTPSGGGTGSSSPQRSAPSKPLAKVEASLPRRPVAPGVAVDAQPAAGVAVRVRLEASCDRADHGRSRHARGHAAHSRD